MSLREKIRAAKAKETVVVIDGDSFLVRAPGRVKKNELVAKSQRKGIVDNALLEANLLACCVLDPATLEPVMSDPDDWDVACHISSPLVRACIEVCDFDSDEAKAMEKKYEATEG